MRGVDCGPAAILRCCRRRTAGGASAVAAEVFDVDDKLTRTACMYGPSCRATPAQHYASCRVPHRTVHIALARPKTSDTCQTARASIELHRHRHRHNCCQGGRCNAVLLSSSKASLAARLQECICIYNAASNSIEPSHVSQIIAPTCSVVHTAKLRKSGCKPV